MNISEMVSSLDERNARIGQLHQAIALEQREAGKLKRMLADALSIEAPPVQARSYGSIPKDLARLMVGQICEIHEVPRKVYQSVYQYSARTGRKFKVRTSAPNHMRVERVA